MTSPITTEENIARNLRLLRRQWMKEFGITKHDLRRWARERSRTPAHDFPPPQANAETCIRGKLRSYREKRNKGKEEQR